MDWLEAWVATWARLRDTTRRMYQSHFRLHFRRLPDGILLKARHIRPVERAFRQLLEEGMSAATARRLFCTLRSALNAAVRERLIPDNPAQYLKLPTGRRPFAVVWTPRRVETAGIGREYRLESSVSISLASSSGGSPYGEHVSAIGVAPCITQRERPPVARPTD